MRLKKLDLLHAYTRAAELKLLTRVPVRFPFCY
jgi:hypothetical protein